MNAASKPPITAALRAGNHSTNRAERRHRPCTSASTSPATIVTCKPDIDIR